MYYKAKDVDTDKALGAINEARKYQRIKTDKEIAEKRAYLEGVEKGLDIAQSIFECSNYERENGKINKVNDMQEIFEKLKERVCEFIHERNKSGSVPCKNQRASCLQLIRVCDLTRIVNQVAEEYSRSNDGWIPCSEKKPDEDSYCYITYEWEDGTLHVCEDTFTSHGWEDTVTSAVIAWKYVDMPAPYQPKGE